jgi:hypothetical protein
VDHTFLHIGWPETQQRGRCGCWVSLNGQERNLFF